MKTIVGLFDTYSEAQNAITQLRSAGIPEGDISLVANPSSAGYEDVASGGTTVERADTATNAASGAGTGASVGAAIGGTAGLLAGLGLIFIPGFGQAIAVGWLVSALTGAGLGAAAGAVIGGLAGALTAVGVPEREAGYYAEGVRRGGALLTVRADESRAQQVADLLDRAGAVDINDRGTYFHKTGYAAHNPNAAPFSREEIARERETYRSWRPTTVGTTTAAGATTAAGTAATVDTRGVGERVADAITGDPIDDKTGKVVKTDTRGVGEKVADAVTGDRVDDKTGNVVR